MFGDFQDGLSSAQDVPKQTGLTGGTCGPLTGDMYHIQALPASLCVLLCMTAPDLSKAC